MAPRSGRSGKPAAPRPATGVTSRPLVSPAVIPAEVVAPPDEADDTAERPKIDAPPPVERDRAPLVETVAPAPVSNEIAAAAPEGAAQVVAPGAGPAPEKERLGGRTLAVVLAGALLFFGAVYAGLHFLAADKLPRGTMISGVDVGGRTVDEAEETLREGLTTRASQPLDVTIDGEPRAITPASAGLSVDYAASIGETEPTGWSPASMWNFYVGSEERDAVVIVDETKLTTVLDDVAAQVASPATEGAINFRGIEVLVTEPQIGRALDTAEAAKSVQDAYLQPDADIDLSLIDAPPEIDAADVQQALDGFANPAVSGATTLVFDAKRVSLKPVEFTPFLAMEPQDGVLVAAVKANKLTRKVMAEVGETGAPVDATVALVDGRPRVVKAKPGIDYLPSDVATALVTAAAASGAEREQKVKPTKEKAEFTTKDARALKIRRKVSTFTTYYPFAAYRNVNIPRAGQLINGTVLKPGETFSLNDTVGERTVANGFTTGFVISGGILKEDLGGGVSQMATTTYNAAFFAGLEDVEHKPHSFFIDRYPVGREATVAWGQTDLKFKNDTPYGVLIEVNVTPAGASSGVVTVSMWSTKVWDITTSTSGRYDYVPPKTQTFKTEDCVPNTGVGGFAVDVQRYFRKPGESDLVRTEDYFWRYNPADTIICEPPDEPVEEN